MSLVTYQTWGNFTPVTSDLPELTTECKVSANIHFVYSLPSLILEAFVAQRLLSSYIYNVRKELHALFYKFLLQDFIIHFIALTSEILMDRISQTGAYFNFLRYNNPKTLITVMTSVWLVAMIGVYVSSAILSTIRTINVRDVRWDQNKMFVWTLIVLQYSIPLLIMWPTFISETIFVYQPADPCPYLFVTTLTAKGISSDYGNYASISVFTALLLWATLCNMVTFLTVARTPTWSKSSSTRRAEMSLTLIAIATFTTIASNMVFQIAFMLVGPTRFTYVLSRTVYDIASFANVWILVLTHPSFRISCGSTTKVQVTEVTTSNF